LVVSPSQSLKPAVQADPHTVAVQVTVVPGEPAPGHTVPHAPQLVMLVLRLVSHPLDATASQLPKPDAHIPTVHAPAEHTPVALLGAHWRLQAPQFIRSVAVATSQPLALLPSQLAKPDEHAKVQLPLLHATCALGPVGHALSQRPQCPRSLRRSRSHPLLALPSQSPNPLRHTYRQLPAEHDATLLGRAAHIAPHAPQWRTSLAVDTSQPLAATMSQSPKLGRQVTWQAPATHALLAPAVALHARPQAPQWEPLDERSASQPLDAAPSQLPQPPSHEKPQAPLEQVDDTPWGGSVHGAGAYPRPSALHTRRLVDVSQS